MKTTTHTPGPWQLIETDCYQTIRVDNHVIADMRMIGGKPYNANDARLIAAAPEMLSLLVELQWSHTQKWPSDDKYHHVCPHCENTPGQDHKPDCQIGRIIARAKGE